MNQRPALLQFTDMSALDVTAPYVSGFRSATETRSCGSCGGSWALYRGPGECAIERGDCWPDLIGAPSHSICLVSERVADGISLAGLSGVEWTPVSITSVSSRALRVLPEPLYFYLTITGRIEFDYRAGGATFEGQCEECGSVSGLTRPPTKYVAREARWDESDFAATVTRAGPIVCTTRVMDVARHQRWSNCRFDPLDIDASRKFRWAGIDFLGESWPPSRWYPPAPSEGKTVGEWLLEFRSDDYERRASAHWALLDIGADAVAGLEELFEDPREAVKRRAAQVLALLHTMGVPVAGELREQIKPFVSERLASRL